MITFNGIGECSEDFLVRIVAPPLDHIDTTAVNQLHFEVPVYQPCRKVLAK